MEHIIEKDALGFIYTEGLIIRKEDRQISFIQEEYLSIENPTESLDDKEIATSSKPKAISTPTLIEETVVNTPIATRASKLMGSPKSEIESPSQVSKGNSLIVTWEGNSQGDIALFSSGLDAEGIAFAKTVFSNAMIDVWKRIRYTGQDFPEAPEALASLAKEGVKFLFVFGGTATSEWYQPSEGFGVKLLKAHPLKELKDTPVAKKQLWYVLQTYFLNK